MASLVNKTVLITGSTDGLGKDVAFEMASGGATILLHGRNPKKGEAVLNEIRKVTNNQAHQYFNADFASLREVYVLAQMILSKIPRVDMLINNAGIGGGEKEKKRKFGADGFELRFTINYLASFLLTTYLLPVLIKSAPSKIINIASGAQEAIDFSDVMMERNYTGSRAYAQSKLALVMFTFDLAEKLGGKGVSVNCLHPASMMDTKLVREEGQPKTFVKEGADTVMYVAVSPETENITGAYFDHHAITRAHEQAYDLSARKKLHELSAKLTETSILHSTIFPSDFGRFT